MLAPADVIHIATDIYNSEGQLSIKQILSSAITAATEGQNPSMSELHVVKVVAVCILISPTDSLDIDQLTYCHMNMH